MFKLHVDRISNTYLVLDFWSPHTINVYTGDTAIWLVQGSEIYLCLCRLFDKWFSGAQ